MSNIWTITWRELKAYFVSPLAYIISAAFLALAGVFFTFEIIYGREAAMRNTFTTMTFILLILAPALTMRLLAEEQRMGTLELLLTSPLHDWQVVVGKFLGSFVLFLTMLVAPMLYYVALLAVFGPPDYGPIVAGFLALILLGGSFLALGVFASSLTQNQVIAFFVGEAIAIVMWIADAFSNIFTSGPLASIFRYLSVSQHYQDAIRGIIDTSDILYAVSIIAIALFLATQVLQIRRWR
jgi:ABC-2 type transport system permease protein